MLTFPRTSTTLSQYDLPTHTWRIPMGFLLAALAIAVIAYFVFVRREKRSADKPRTRSASSGSGPSTETDLEDSPNDITPH